MAVYASLPSHLQVWRSLLSRHHTPSGVVWIMFVATGISTKTFAHNNIPAGDTCEDTDTEQVKKICNEWEPIEIVSWITAGLGECSPRQSTSVPHSSVLKLVSST